MKLSSKLLLLFSFLILVICLFFEIPFVRILTYLILLLFIFMFLSKVWHDNKRCWNLLKTINYKKAIPWTLLYFFISLLFITPGIVLGYYVDRCIDIAIEKLTELSSDKVELISKDVIVPSPWYIRWFAGDKVEQVQEETVEKCSKIIVFLCSVAKSFLLLFLIFSQFSLFYILARSFIITFSRVLLWTNTPISFFVPER